MSDPTREELKVIAEWCAKETACEGCPAQFTSVQFCREAFARALLSAFELIDKLEIALSEISCRTDHGDNGEPCKICAICDAAIKAAEEGR